MRSRSSRIFNDSLTLNSRTHPSGFPPKCTSHRRISTAPSRPPSLPKPHIDLKHIRDSPGLYEINCNQRNYKDAAKHSWNILEGHQRWQKLNRDVQKLYSQQKEVQEKLKKYGMQSSKSENQSAKDTHELVKSEARELKDALSVHTEQLSEIEQHNFKMALGLPNLASPHVPDGDTPETREYINIPAGSSPPVIQAKHDTSHVEIGKYLDIIDIPAAAALSGWGFYFLKGAGAMLEQALIQHALSQAIAASFIPISPPSLVYQYAASAAGYQPRDTHGEQQIYEIRKDDKEVGPNESPRLVLTGTSEIPLAGLCAGANIPESSFPIKNVAISRCYRAEAGARGRDTKGLYRVHEFTKVELFAWTLPDNYVAQRIDERFDTSPETASSESSGDVGGEDMTQPATKMFYDMLALQKAILSPLDLPLRILDMPMIDLGASAARKFDIEAFFPSRTHNPWGELSSLSLCTDYQSRRLFTRVSRGGSDGKPVFPYTLNGTAMAVPRVLAAIVENGWDEERKIVRLPECLWGYMGKREIAKVD